MTQPYEIGSFVYYDGLGICQVTEYETMGDENFVILKSVNKKNPLKVFIPLSQAEQVGKINTPLNREQVDEVLTSKFKKIEWNTNKRERQDQFLTIIHSNNFLDIISLILCLRKRTNQLKKEKKRLSTFDGDILKKAIRLCKETVAYAYEISPEKAGEYLKNKFA